MVLEDLKNALKDNSLTATQISATAVGNIMRYVDVQIMMDRTTMEYYYVIDVDELLESEMPKEDLDDLKEEGWSFSEDGKEIILYLTA